MKKNIGELAQETFDLARNKKQEDTLLELLTPKEKIMIGRRLLIAQKILKGQTRYEINEHIKISPNTFAQINRWLENSFDEYASAYKKPIQHIDKRYTSRRTKSFSYQDLKQKYPAHFLLFSAIEEMWKR